MLFAFSGFMRAARIERESKFEIQILKPLGGVAQSIRWDRSNIESSFQVSPDCFHPIDPESTWYQKRSAGINENLDPCSRFKPPDFIPNPQRPPQKAGARALLEKINFLGVKRQLHDFPSRASPVNRARIRRRWSISAAISAPALTRAFTRDVSPSGKGFHQFICHGQSALENNRECAATQNANKRIAGRCQGKLALMAGVIFIATKMFNIDLPPTLIRNQITPSLGSRK